MRRTFPDVAFERFADDVAIHCRTKWQAESVLNAIRDRLLQCGLELHPTKTRIVYCKDTKRPGKYEHVSFDFLGFTFRPRPAKGHWKKMFFGFLPAISAQAAKGIRATIRSWRLPSTRHHRPLEELAHAINPAVRGWMNYYGRFYRSQCVLVLRHLNKVLAAWVRRKYPHRLHRRERASIHWLGRLARREPNLFAHWQFGIRPEAGS